MLKIVQAPSSVLSEKAKPIEKIDASMQKLIKEMAQTLASAKDPEGVGLAAPQIGKSLQLFIIKESPNAQLRVFINPKIKRHGKVKIPVRTEGEKKGVKLEGCLSLQDIWGIVDRAPWVTLSYTDEQGKQHTEKFTGFLAVIIQHEYDHINGILFPKRVLEQKEKLYKATKDEKGEIIFEEISL